MSLTYHLGDGTSPVHRFLYERFPDVGKPLGQARAALKGCATIRPQGRVPYTTLGMALDYRIRYYFHVTPVENLQATRGAGAMQHSAPVLHRAYHDEFVSSLHALLADVEPAQRKLAREDEHRLLRYCVVLALYEEVYRRGEALQYSPLTKLGSVDLDSLLSVTQPHWLDDLREMSWIFYERCGDLLSRPAVLNPTFEGSTDVGGADADLIVDGRLYEVKATVKLAADKFQRWMYQLLGYTLLDYGDQHGITGVGFYFARQGVLVGWNLPDVLDTMAGGTTRPLGDLRASFRRAAKRRF